MRAQNSTRDFIDQAAKSIGKDRADFMPDTACEKAQEILIDRTEFLFNDAQWDASNRIRPKAGVFNNHKKLKVSFFHKQGNTESQ